MTIIRPSFRNGFYAGLLAAIVAGVYLLQLWKPERQIELHSLHLLHAIERNDPEAIGDFIDPAYKDQWQHDRALLVARLRAVLGFTRNLHLEPREPLVVPTLAGPEWQARITVSGDPSELMTVITARINPLTEPFHLRWRKQSWKPWEWKLIHASNEALELPSNDWNGGEAEVQGAKHTTGQYRPLAEFGVGGVGRRPDTAIAVADYLPRAVRSSVFADSTSFGEPSHRSRARNFSP